MKKKEKTGRIKDREWANLYSEQARVKWTRRNKLSLAGYPYVCVKPQHSHINASAESNIQGRKNSTWVTKIEHIVNKTATTRQ